MQRRALNFGPAFCSDFRKECLLVPEVPVGCAVRNPEVTSDSTQCKCFNPLRINYFDGALHYFSPKITVVIGFRCR